MKTQEQTILQALKNHPEGLHPKFFIEDLHIYQYNARLFSLREQFKCECKNGYRCSAQEHIVNKRLSNNTTVFVYIKNGMTTNWEKLRTDTIQSSVNSSEGLPF